MQTHTGQVVSLQPYVGRLRTVSAQLAFEPIRLLFDTGGGQTLLTPKTAQRLGFQPSGRSVSYRMNGEKVILQQCFAGPLTIGPLFIKKMKVGILDLAQVLPPGLPEVDGILALDVFATNPFSIDLAENRLIFESPISMADRLNGLKPTSIQSATGMDGNALTVFVSSRTPAGKEAWFLLDSGNLDTVLVSQQIASEYGISINASQPHSIALQVGSLGEETSLVSLRELIYDGALNAEFFEKHLLTFDLERRQMWIR